MFTQLSWQPTAKLINQSQIQTNPQIWVTNPQTRVTNPQIWVTKPQMRVTKPQIWITKFLIVSTLENLGPGKLTHFPRNKFLAKFLRV